MPIPRDRKLYEQTKRSIYKSHPKHSAYRSGLLVKAYKKAYSRKHGSSSAYSGKKSQTSGLSRWFAEKWRNQRGGVGYQRRSDVYRPTRRVSPKTPKTFAQISKKQLKRAQREKSKTGRVRRF